MLMTYASELLDMFPLIRCIKQIQNFAQCVDQNTYYYANHIQHETFFLDDLGISLNSLRICIQVQLI